MTSRINHLVLYIICSKTIRCFFLTRKGILGFFICRFLSCAYQSLNNLETLTSRNEYQIKSGCNFKLSIKQMTSLNVLLMNIPRWFLSVSGMNAWMNEYRVTRLKVVKSKLLWLWMWAFLTPCGKDQNVFDYRQFHFDTGCILGIWEKYMKKLPSNSNLLPWSSG